MSHIVTIEKMVAGGDCMTKIQGKNVFVPYAIPGEKVSVDITKSFRDYDLAEIREIIEPSAHRAKPFCPLYGKCGGCNMQHIDFDYQIELRKGILRDSFVREGLKVPEIEVVSGAEKGYRSRIQLTDGGFNEKGSGSVVRIDFCPVATEEINSYLAKTPWNERPAGRTHIFGDRHVLGENHVIIADEKDKSQAQEKIIGESKKKSRLKVKKNTYFKGSVQDEKNLCSVELLGKRIDFDTRGFFQSNLEVLEKSIGKIMLNTGGKNVLDMYAGCGTFSVFLSDIFEKTTLVEHNRDAIVFAEKNLLGKKHESYGQSGEKWVSDNAPKILCDNGGFDAVVIDPPRSGMEKGVRDWLCKNKTGQIRSVSCNPSTHARDAAFLVKSGYSLEKLYLLDFYPQTSHIESLAFFDYFDS